MNTTPPARWGVGRLSYSDIPRSPCKRCIARYEHKMYGLMRRAMFGSALFLPARPLSRRQDHDHLLAFKPWFQLDFGKALRNLLHLHEKLHANVLVRHFTAAKP